MAKRTDRESFEGQAAALEGAARRAVRADTPEVPAALRARIEALCAIDAESPAAKVERGRWRIGAGWAMAAAVLLLIGGGIAGALIGRSALPKVPAVAQGPTTAAVIPAAYARSVTRVHVDCSRFLGKHTLRVYPRDLGALAASVEKDFGGTQAWPDLSAMGYAFVGAGPCAEPLAGTVHLLYRTTKPDSADTLSLFVQAWAGQYKMDAGRLYLVDGPQSPHPMYAWRTGGVVYFLVTDGMDTARDAAQKLRADLAL